MEIISKNLVGVVAILVVVWLVGSIIREAFKYYRKTRYSSGDLGWPKHKHDYGPWQDVRDSSNELVPFQRKRCKNCMKIKYRIIP